MKYLLILSLVCGMFITGTASAEVYYHGHHGYYRDDARADRSDRQNSQEQNDRRQPRCYDNGYCHF